MGIFGDSIGIRNGKNENGASCKAAPLLGFECFPVNYF